MTSNVRYFFDSPVYVRQTPLTLTLAPLTNFVLNLLGDLWFKNGRAEEPNFDEVDDIDINIHLYGKNSPRKGRKMGHITVIGDNVDKLVNKAEDIRLKLWRI